MQYTQQQIQYTKYITVPLMTTQYRYHDSARTHGWCR